MKKILVGLIMSLIFILVACSEPTEEEIIYDIQKKLNDMESYSCIAEMTIQGNKSSKEYKAQQTFENPNKYILEFFEPIDSKGYTTIFNGNQLWLYHPLINQSVVLKDYDSYSENESMFIGYFLEFFNTNEESNVYTETIDNNEYLVFNTTIPGGNKYRYSQKLWINKATFIPYKMITLDNEENITISVIFKDFKYNIEIGENKFNIKL